MSQWMLALSSHWGLLRTFSTLRTLYTEEIIGNLTLENKKSTPFGVLFE